jgi:hypothetical protein
MALALSFHLRNGLGAVVCLGFPVEPVSLENPDVWRVRSFSPAREAHGDRLDTPTLSRIMMLSDE